MNYIMYLLFRQLVDTSVSVAVRKNVSKYYSRLEREQCGYRDGYYHLSVVNLLMEGLLRVSFSLRKSIRDRLIMNH